MCYNIWHLLGVIMGNIKRDVKGNVIIVKITDTITIDEYISFADMYNINDKYVTNNELFFDENRSDDLCIKPKEMYLLKENNMIFSVVRTDDNLIKITQKTYTDDDILENSIEIDTEDETYKIIKIEHDKDGNTKVIKIYNSNKNIDFFKLD